MRNPFYCGFLLHGILNGKVVKGKHSALISEELFLLANGVLKENRRNRQGYKQHQINDNIPLKRFVICAECGTPFTGYIVRKKNLWYYKCNKVGCKCNKSAKHLHDKFEEILSHYILSKKFITPISDIISGSYLKRSSQSVDESDGIKTKITELEKDIFTVEERYALGKINEEVYDRISSKMRAEKKGVRGIFDKVVYKFIEPL